MDDPWEEARPGAGAPPPPAAAPTVEARLRALERDVAALSEFRDRVTERLADLGPSAPAPSAPAGEGEALRAARAQAARLERQLEEALRARGSPAADLEAKHARLLAEHEKLLGEHQALRLLHAEATKRSSGAVRRADVPTTGHAAADEALQALARENAQLREELSTVKREATTRIKALKVTAERARDDADTMRHQKDNLLRELAARDGGDAALAPRELTLEEITASEVFKTMLGNIRRTSREEVTHLHDAVARLRTVHPEGYNLLLDLVAREFAGAGVENPLALLPRA